ncbi:MAG: response regulator [Frankiales bacterium]|nr:response regulator [Frankiales bacterium]
MPTAYLVDDAPDIRLLLRAIVTRCGYDSREAGHGGEALQLLDEVAPDLVVLDVQMPEMDGWETLQALRRDPRSADVPIILCTVKSHPDDMRRGWQAGCDGFLTKPFDIGEIVACISAVESLTVEQRREVRLRQLAALAEVETAK